MGSTSGDDAMPDSAEMTALADRMESYLVSHLLPFWQTRAPDRECGEWYERVNRAGEPLDDALGHGWKSGYHTVRSMVQCIRRLRSMAGGGKQ
jgi:mannose/cellobiose epimerase-like protein (N-acyl-D-glucosamine 2-epimerase family)